MADNSAFPDAELSPSGIQPAAFIMHHTAGRAPPAGVVADWQNQGRGYGAQYIMDRDGVIHDTKKEFGYGGTNEILNGTGVGQGLSNSNVVGMEIVAKNDADVTPQQAQTAAQFIAARYPNTPVFGHGQVNAGHKEATEGASAVAAVNAMRGGPSASASAVQPGSPIAPDAQPITGTTTLNTTGPLGANHAAFIANYAKQIGVDPNLALGIANREGLNAWSASNPNAASTIDRTNGVPWSFGDFQLNVRNGLGTMARQAGIDPADPKQWQAADKFALDQMKAGGVGPWKGDPVAANYLKSGAVPNMSALLTQASNAPVSTTPGNASAGASGSNASTAATAAAGALGTPAGPSLPGFGQQQSNQFLQGASGLDKALGGQGLGGQSGDGQSGGGDMKPSPIIQGAPPHIPNPAQAAQTFGQTLNSMRTPPQWGPNPVGAPIYATAGQQGPEINPEAQQMLQQLQMQQQMQMMQGGGMGTSLNSYGGFGYG